MEAPASFFYCASSCLCLLIYPVMGFKRYFAYQGNDFDCGFAALKMLLCHAHKSSRYLQLAKPTHRRDRYSYRDLLDIAKENGVTLVAYKLINKEEIRKLQKLPVLLSLRNRNNSLHLVLLRKMTRHRVHYDDPRMGPSIMDYQDFIKRWDGSFMQVAEVERVAPLKRETPILETRKRWALVILQSLSALFALLGFAFVSSQSYFIFPLLFLGLFVISELLFRRYQFSVLQEFDHRYLLRTYDENKKLMREKFTNFFDFKKTYFLFPQILIGSIIISVFSISILTLNDVRHLFFLMAILFFAICDLLLSKYVDEKNQKILEEIEEKTFETASDKKDVVTNYEHMSCLAHFIAKSAMARKYIGIFLIAASALTYAAISKEATLNYFLFHFFVYLLFYENAGKVISTLLRAAELKRKVAAFKDEFVR